MNHKVNYQIPFSCRLLSGLIIILLIVNTVPVKAQATVYKGTSSYTSDIICHVKDGKIYKKNSNYTSDILFTIKCDLTLPEFVGVWWVVNYIY